jgi:hypothetical protein
MTAIYWREDPGVARIRDSGHSPIIWTSARLAGVYFDFRDGAWVTFGLTRDAQNTDIRRWEADTALSSLGRAIREHEKLAVDPLLRLAYLYVTLDYVTALWSKRG